MTTRKKKNNVLSLNGAAPAIPLVHPDIVRELAEILALAKAGQIHGLVYGAIKANGDIRTVWVGDAPQHSMSSAAAVLNWKVQCAVVAND